MPDLAVKRFPAWLVLGCILAGCDGGSEPANRATSRTRAGDKLRQSHAPAVEPRSETPTAIEPFEFRQEETEAEEPRSLADSLEGPGDSAPRWIENLPRLRVDDARAAAAGIHKLSGRHLTLYSDMPPGEQIEQLPRLFDEAFPQWCEYFHVDAAAHSDWKMTGFVMKDTARFRQAGLLPDGLPPFQHAYSRNFELWVYDQPSDYYRRHLLLHEGTHGFMNTVLGGCGPPWYMEGIAELLATHQWHDGRLTLNQMPAGRDDVPHWGRIRIIKDAIAEGRLMQLQSVIRYPRHAHLDNEPYAWCWAAAALLDGHPRYQSRFRQLQELVLKPDFSERFRRLIGEDWSPLCEEWQLLVTGLEYGHDVARTAVDFTPGRPLSPEGAAVTVVADRGWQNSGLRLEAGVDYPLQASGRYQVADRPQIWWCEPGGVSIRYYRDRPLGILLAAVRADRGEPGVSGLLRPVVVGLAATLSPEESGTLYLKINDSPGELDDNAGELKVRVRKAD